MAEKIITEDLIKDIKKAFEQLGGPVTVAVFTSKDKGDEYSRLARQLIEEISEVDERIRPEFHETGDKASKKYGVAVSPTILISPEKYKIMFRGAPLGEEGRTLIMALIMASTGRGALHEPSAHKLQKLEDRRLVKVFVSPT